MSRDLYDYEAIEALEIRDRLDTCIAMYREFIKQGNAKENPDLTDKNMMIANEMCLKTMLFIRYADCEFDDLGLDEKKTEEPEEKKTEPESDHCSSCMHNGLDPMDEICYDCVRFGKGFSNYSPKPEEENEC